MAMFKTYKLQIKRLSDWAWPYLLYTCLKETHFKYKGTNRLKVKSGKDIQCKH